jgi:hypothetical protein
LIGAAFRKAFNDGKFDGIGELNDEHDDPSANPAVVIEISDFPPDCLRRRYLQAAEEFSFFTDNKIFIPSHSLRKADLIPFYWSPFSNSSTRKEIRFIFQNGARLPSFWIGKSPFGYSSCHVRSNSVLSNIQKRHRYPRKV